MIEMNAGNYTQERERLGKLVRQYWVDWAKSQPNPKPNWLIPWDELSPQDKEADRCIGFRLYLEFVAETTKYRMFANELKMVAEDLRWALHGFRELFDEDEPHSGRLIEKFDKLKEVYGEFF